MAITVIPGNLLSSGTSAVDPSISGWNARLNCTISLGSGGRNGDGCLKLTSAAAGEMQAQTAAIYPVVAGQTYFAFADASAATQPERIGILWLTSSAVPVGAITWSLTTIAPSATWHRISVAGVCPVGASRARIVFSSQTPSGAGILHYFENVYLGLPLRQPGNLLSFNAESAGEVDATAWTGGPNSTVSRVAATVAWPVDFWYAGGHSLQVAVIAAGEASAVTVERAPVTAGDEYVAYSHLQPPTSGSNVWIELRYYDAGGVQVQATRSQLAAPGTGWYRQIVSAVAPSTAVTAAVAVGITGASLGHAIRAECVYLAPVAVATASTQRTDSLLPMADWDFEQGIGSWTVASGVATLARSTPWNAQSIYDYYSLTISSSTATASTIRSGIYPLPAGSDGLNFRFETYLSVTSGGFTFQRRVRWLDGVGALISTTSGSTVPASTPGWWSGSTDNVAPSSAVSAQLELVVTATAPTSVLQLDRPAFWQVEPLIGATPDDGTASVQIVLRELDPAYTLTLWRVTEDGARTLVRGPTGLIDQVVLAGDSYSVTDYEAPLGVPVYYQAELRDPVTGAIVESRRTQPLTLPIGINDAWLKDPIEPQRNLRLVAQSPPSWERGIEQGEFRVRGRRNAVVLSDVREGYSGELKVFTRDDDERHGLHWLLDTGHTLLIQAAPGNGVEDTYVAVGQVTEGRATDYAPEPWRVWTLPLTQVDRPTGGTAGSALRTWQDVRVENATWGDVLARYATWLDVLLDQPKQAG